MTIATIDGDHLENFTDHFKLKGHANSDTSAIRMNNQAIKEPSFFIAG